MNLVLVPYMMGFRSLIMAFLLSSIGYANTRSMFYDLTTENLPENFVEIVKARSSGKFIAPKYSAPTAINVAAPIAATTVASPVAALVKPKSKFRDLLNGESLNDVPELFSDKPKLPVQITVHPVPAVPRPDIVTTELPSVLSCEQNGQNQCDNIHYDIGQRGRSTQADYVKYMAPIAQYMQAKTGLPASIIIAQSIEETGSGGSGHAKYYNGLFGHTCGRLGTNTSVTFAIQNESFSSKGTCSVRAYDPQTGKTVNYIRFNTPESSVAGYIHNVLYNSGTQGVYAKVRQEVQNVRAKDPNGDASWQRVLLGLRGYAENPSYTRNLTNIIRANGLEKFDKNSCQSCMQQRENQKKGSDGAPATS